MVFLVLIFCFFLNFFVRKKSKVELTTKDIGIIDGLIEIFIRNPMIDIISIVNAVNGICKENKNIKFIILFFIVD